MLVITRKLGESFVIVLGTDKIEVVLKDVRGKNVRLGVVADEKYKVFRKELTDDNEQHNQQNNYATVRSDRLRNFLKQTLLDD